MHLSLQLVSSFPERFFTNQTLDVNGQVGGVCRDSDNPDGCVDYEVRFCCEGCCPQLNVSGNPELTEYYENYPGVYLLQEETFNDMVTYKQLAGLWLKYDFSKKIE